MSALPRIRFNRLSDRNPLSLYSAVFAMVNRHGSIFTKSSLVIGMGSISKLMSALHILALFPVCAAILFVPLPLPICVGTLRAADALAILKNMRLEVLCLRLLASLTVAETTVTLVVPLILRRITFV